MSDHELKLECILDAPRQAVWRCWTEPALITQWFCPKPWQTVKAEIDLRAGGSSYYLMRGPNGEEHPNRGVVLEVVPNERLIFTDAFTKAWEPSGKAFMVGGIELSDAGPGKTRYVAFARHWNAQDREQHEKMGFHEGWGKAAEQLEELAKTLA